MHARVWRPGLFGWGKVPGFEPAGAGEHLLLTVEKRGMNTAFAAKRIAAWAGVSEMAVGYAGLKDRHALTRQRFSVQLPGREPPPIESLESEDLRVLAQARHLRKLPRGALAGNRFVLTLRDVVADRAAVDARLRHIASEGVPNYFGEQRFGRGGDNVESALAMFAGRRVKREQRSLLISAARSQLFNQVLATRVLAQNWNRALDGEVWALEGSRSVFGPQPFDPALQQRLDAFDIHPSGPLWGRGTLRSTGEAMELEQAAISDERSHLLRAGLERAGLEQERRSLRLRPAALEWSWRETDVLELRFDLPPGAYATVVLAELGDVSGQ